MLNHILDLLQHHGTTVEDLIHYETENMRKKTQNCCEAKILYQTRLGQYSSPKRSTAGLLYSQMFTGCCKGEELTVHIGKHRDVLLHFASVSTNMLDSSPQASSRSPS